MTSEAKTPADVNRSDEAAQKRLEENSPGFRVATRTQRYLDERLGTANFLRRSYNKIFPDHWSFMLGEIALYSFVVLLLTGTYLAFFFKPSMTEVIYDGSYAPLHGVKMSEAYESTISLSFDVRAGLVFRQMHHWAALLFVASIVVHSARVFFSAAFRKPREINWHIGVGLLLLAIAEGFAGYSLPDDLLSGTGLRIGYSIGESIPVIGTWLVYSVWGGEYPGEEIVPRLYLLHILVIPGVILALISAHMGILWHQKHTDFPGAGKSDRVIVGSRLFPKYAAKSAGFFMLVVGMLAALGGLAQINPVWLYGPYEPSVVSAASQPDWYVGWLDGSLRVMMPWEIRAFGQTIPLNLFLPGVVLPLLLFSLMALYPEIEARVTGDHRSHNELDLPRNHPIRSAIGAAAFTFYFVLLLAGGSDVLATTFGISLNAVVWGLRILLFLAPAVAFIITMNWCRGLMQDDDDLLLEGRATGVIEQLPVGEYVEVHTPLPVQPVPVREPGDPEAEIAEATERAQQDSIGYHAAQVLKLARGRIRSFFTQERLDEPEPLHLPDGHGDAEARRRAGKWG